MPNPPAAPSPARHTNGRFGAGNSGRPRGARNRVSQRVALAILEDFEAHQTEILPDLRKYRMPLYLRLVSRLLPASTDVGLADYSGMSDEALAEKITEMRSALDWLSEGQGTLLDLEAVLVGELEMSDD
jgi:hypothetical protein